MENKKFILSGHIGLRSWRLVPHAYYTRGSQFARGLTEEEFLFLLGCDGEQEQEHSPIADSLLRRGFIRLAGEGETLTDWQRYRAYDNRYMPLMNLELTAKCSYNCLHCFNASDNAPLHAELSYEEAVRILDEAQGCGINALLLTGGEPMLHPRFMDIVRELYRRDMFLFELNTNGFFLTQSVLDGLHDIGADPLMKISFDGLGYHDWMRNREGAEKDALRAISLSIQNGFRVMVQYNINRKNAPSLRESLTLLDSMGVSSVRLIRTTPAPRWEQNAAGQSLDIKEYFDLGLETARWYASGEHKAELIIWQVCTVRPERKQYSLDPVRASSRRFRDTLPLCKGARGMIAVGANGQVYPCMQMSGWFDSHGVDLGNVKRDGLRKLLGDSAYMDCVCLTVRDRMEQNGKCRSCRYIEYCLGGCPALGILGSETGSILDPDPFRCYFYEQGYYDKFVSALPGYINLSEMEECTC